MGRRANHPVFESLRASKPPLLGKEGNKKAKQEHVYSPPGKGESSSTARGRGSVACPKIGLHNM